MIWPTRREVIFTGIFVFILAVIVAIFLFLVDQALIFGLRTLLGVGNA